MIRAKNVIVRKVKTMTQKQIYELKKKRRLQRQRRRNATVLLALLLIVVCTLFSCGAKQKQPSITEYITYIVSDGDTIWEIAQYYCGNCIDIGIAVNQIEEINGISNATIYSGDSLLVPVYSH